MGVGGQRHAPATLFPEERSGTLPYEVGWATGSVSSGVKNPHRDSIPGVFFP
jgi:hypothetical protein